jgi:hypothetical protein
MSPFGAQIIADRAMPGAMRDTDQELLKAQQTMTSITNRGALQGWLSSTITVRAGSFTLFCRKDDVHQRMSTLFCLAAKVPFSFSYQGSSKWEKEAETILSTLE